MLKKTSKKIDRAEEPEAVYLGRVHISSLEEMEELDRENTRNMSYDLSMTSQLKHQNEYNIDIKRC